MRKKPYRGNEFFDIIKNVLVETQKLPVILDYSLEDRSAFGYEMIDSEVEMKMDVRFGGSEGIYLDIYLVGVFRQMEEHVEEKIRIGTFKTLHESDDAFRMMALLGADFILAAKKYVREHSLDFEWVGFYLSATPKTEDAPKRPGLFMVDIQDAFQTKLDWERKCPDYDVKLLKLETKEYV